MAQYSIGEAIEQLFASNNWRGRMLQGRIVAEWETIVGKTMAKYTSNIVLTGTTLNISTEIAPLKHEIQMSKETIIERINAHFNQQIVTQIVVR